MRLVETHVVTRNKANFKACDDLCFLSKNLYNQALYAFNEEYKKTGKFIRYNEMEKIMKMMPLEYNNYQLLSASVSQQVLMVFDQNVKSFLGLIKLWKKDKKKLNGCPKFMKYKHKEKGRNLIVIRGDKHVCKVRNGLIYFPKKLNLAPIKSLKVSTQEDLYQVRIIPQKSCYIIEIVYKINDPKPSLGQVKAAIDLGIDNLAVLTFSSGERPVIYNGKGVKSINKYYNKLKAKKQSELMKCNSKYSSRGMNELTNKRNNKIKDLLHKISKEIVEELKDKKVGELVIGYNKEWKSGVNLGKKFNQTFVSIPYGKFIDMLKYKCALAGIGVILNEESYTSKCSSLDLEPLKKHEKYVGERVKRGLFRTSSGLLVNADVNGSLNIGRKVFGDAYVYRSKQLPANIGLVVNPLKVEKFS